LYSTCADRGYDRVKLRLGRQYFLHLYPRGDDAADPYRRKGDRGSKSCRFSGKKYLGYGLRSGNPRTAGRWCLYLWGGDSSVGIFGGKAWKSADQTTISGSSRSVWLPYGGE